MLSCAKQRACWRDDLFFAFARGGWGLESVAKHAGSEAWYAVKDSIDRRFK